jgi:hypothetical protein
LLAGLLCGSAYSQNYKPFPGDTVDQRTRSIQERVEAVYSAGDHERALLIYEQELAPIGDKYAQYMVGYMHLHGEGTEQDNSEALAWFRLAAERGEPLLGQIRDELIFRMTSAELTASDLIFLDLWKQMGDQALIIELINRDMRILRAQTGTRIPGATTTGPAFIYRPSGELVGPNFYRDVRARLQMRIEYLDARVEINDIVLAEELEGIRNQEAAVKSELAAMEN